ncbi:UNKNOWN [Stylonychia lemnae]|uniref:Uncharacterized protein n=1 Tax=Stylonychia lemnae TaxID=5949 RepID=A0A078B6V3_STYLE|nr:UNKNOWN [Stylonychia lemnae]|eukprot:CDW89293.1 UNKNOWN [Stylonychia lemnae]
MAKDDEKQNQIKDINDDEQLLRNQSTIVSSTQSFVKVGQENNSKEFLQGQSVVYEPENQEDQIDFEDELQIDVEFSRNSEKINDNANAVENFIESQNQVDNEVLNFEQSKKATMTKIQSKIPYRNDDIDSNDSGENKDYASLEISNSQENNEQSDKLDEVRIKLNSEDENVQGIQNYEPFNNEGMNSK